MGQPANWQNQNSANERRSQKSLFNVYLPCSWGGVGFAVTPFQGSVSSVHLLNSDCCPPPIRSFAIFALKDKYALRC